MGPAHAGAAPRGRRRWPFRSVRTAVLGWTLCAALSGGAALAQGLASAGPLAQDRGSVAALAQGSGSLALLSDYRYRGVSLTQGKPAAQVSGAYDHPDGWYAGGALTAVLARCLRDCGGVQGVAYAGYATRHANGVTWEAGSDFLFGAGRASYRFGEAFVGLGYRDTHARLFYAPRYFGQDAAAVYAELNQSFPVGNQARLLGHVGVLRVDPRGYGLSSVTRADALLGGSLDLGPVELQLTWQHAQATAAGYAAYPNERRSAWVLVASWLF